MALNNHSYKWWVYRPNMHANYFNGIPWIRKRGALAWLSKGLFSAILHISSFDYLTIDLEYLAAVIFKFTGFCSL